MSRNIYRQSTALGFEIWSPDYRAMKRRKRIERIENIARFAWRAVSWVVNKTLDHAIEILFVVAIFATMYLVASSFQFMALVVDGIVNEDDYQMQQFEKAVAEHRAETASY